MTFRLLYLLLLIMQVSGEGPPRSPRVDLEAIIDRASKEPDLDGAGLILSSLLSDESTIRSAFATSLALDERTVYILFGEILSSRARATGKDGTQLHRIRVESVSTKPDLIRSVIRADRYETFFRRRSPGGAATLNYFPFFSYSPYADDLMETFIENLRKKSSQPAKAVMSQEGFVLVKADEMEVNLLDIWQIMCGLCDRLDLIYKTTTKNWRVRFPELDKWFHENRPYLLWDHRMSCIRIDEDAKELGRPTPRASRSIPELKPPWLTGDALKNLTTPRK